MRLHVPRHAGLEHNVVAVGGGPNVVRRMKRRAVVSIVGHIADAVTPFVGVEGTRPDSDLLLTQQRERIPVWQRN